MKKILMGIGSCIGVALSYCVKASYIVGSRKAFFSATSVIVPLTGLVGGASVAWIVGLFRMIFLMPYSWQGLAFVLPGLCASLYWKYDQAWIRFWIPCIAFCAFLAHPVGYQAGWYACYWLIPMSIYMIAASHFWLHALASTFIAHAVGSVIWLYTIEMTAEQWLGLIPLVALERMIITAGMVVGYSVICSIRNLIAGYNKVGVLLSHEEAEVVIE
ncbi:MAG: hypothetical protein WBQ73_03870 [Candidatus Babeliales bacterium]